MNRVFVIRGFGVKKDSNGNEVDFEKVHGKLIQPALERCGLSGGTTTIVEDAGNIRTDMFELIIQADLVICDITVHNANVFYELGVRHSLRKKHTVLIKGSPSGDGTPFDLSTDRYLKYSVASPETAVDSLESTIRASLNSIRETDSPIFLLLPTLSEANPAEITATPIDLIEEIERADAVSDVALLRVITEDLVGQRFEREGLRLVGLSQWNLKDWDGARLSWEKIRKADPDDFEANRVLANIYERQYRDNGREVLLEMSNRAIRTVLDSERCSVAQRAEALALQGRNLKTLWRAEVCSAPDVDAARRKAINARALQSYESYRAAFDCDLNSFFPGLAALQMGHILQLLTEQPGWRNLFKGDDRQARRFQEDLERDLPALTHVVEASVKRAQYDRHNEEPEWADVSAADLLFLAVAADASEQDASMLVQAYCDAIPSNKLFVWDSCIGQLQLFGQLGFKQEAVRAVIKAFEAPVIASPKEHLVVFSGHTPDTGEMSPRFPVQAEESARNLIREAIVKLHNELDNQATLTVLASAAPGADILVHEVCAELGIKTRLCLPMPSKAVAIKVFKDADEWRTRFFNLVNNHQDPVFQLAEYAELPRWLQGRDNIDPWERGNRWVMQLARTWGASRVTLLAFWDRKDDTSSGGTAQFVRMAQAAGEFELRVIDSQVLFN